MECITLQNKWKLDYRTILFLIFTLISRISSFLSLILFYYLIYHFLFYLIIQFRNLFDSIIYIFFFILIFLIVKYYRYLLLKLISSSWARLRHDVLSTSNCGGYSLSSFGFGPVVPEGLGVGYIIKVCENH
jgi:hypothetical protein